MRLVLPDSGRSPRPSQIEPMISTAGSRPTPERQRPASPAQPSAASTVGRQPNSSHPPEPIGSQQASGRSPRTDRPGSGTTVDVSAVSLAGVGGAAGGGVVGGLAWRRRIQLQTRPPGRRIVHPSPATRPVEVALGQRQRPLSLRTLDRADAGDRRPLQRIRDRAAPTAAGACSVRPRSSSVAGSVSVCTTGFHRARALLASDSGRRRYLKSVPGLSEAARPWPALVSLGRDDRRAAGAWRPGVVRPARA